jgi:hypothetical protein
VLLKVVEGWRMVEGMEGGGGDRGGGIVIDGGGERRVMSWQCLLTAM